MELGEKLRQARMEAGLSQRALCGEEITRNMLSRIENGAARPSMGTLQYLAARLGKPVSYFLEETAVCSPNQAVMAKARQLFDEGDFAGVKQALSGYRAPDETYDRERQLLESVTLLNLAEQAIGDGKEPYARELLENAAEAIGNAPYCGKELERQCDNFLKQMDSGDGSVDIDNMVINGSKYSDGEIWLSIDCTDF